MSDIIIENLYKLFVSVRLMLAFCNENAMTMLQKSPFPLHSNSHFIGHAHTQKAPQRALSMEQFATLSESAQE